MFLLQNLPDEKIFKKFKKDYPDLDIPSTALYLRLLKTGSDLLNLLDEFLADYDLTHGRWIILILLHREDDHKATPSALAEKQGVTRATISNLLDRLERDGLVERISCERDGRSVHVELTVAGKDKLDSVMPDYYRMVKDLFGHAQKVDIQGVTQFLDTLQATLHKDKTT